MASGFDSLGPAGYAWQVTPSDSTVFTLETRGLYIGTSGDLVVKMYSPDTNKLVAVTLASVPAGTVLPIKTIAVMAATTASGIVALA